jgi:hypothetical protein
MNNWDAGDDRCGQTETQERPMDDEPPGHKALEIRTDGQLANAEAHFNVADCILGPVEGEDPKVRAGIQTAPIYLADLHEGMAGARTIAGVHQVAGLHDRVRVEVDRILTGHDLLHLERWPRTASNDWLDRSKTLLNSGRCDPLPALDRPPAVSSRQSAGHASPNDPRCCLEVVLPGGVA